MQLIQKQIDTVRIGMFHFRFANMSAFQNALLNTKIEVMREQVVDDMWPIGDFIYFIHKIRIPFQLTYVKPDKVDDKESERLYMTEFLPLYIKCIKTGIIGQPEYTTP
jgi:hypothetical protein